MDTRPTLLLVTDDKDFAQTICLILDTAGYRLLTTPYDIDLVDILQNEAVSLILFDVPSASAESHQMSQQMLAILIWLKIPIVVLTTNLYAINRVIDKMDYLHYLTKPFRPADLIATVRRNVAETSLHMKDRLEIGIGNRRTPQREGCDGVIGLAINR